MRTFRYATILICGAALAACDSGAPTSPTASLDADLGVVELVTGGLSSYASAGSGYMISGGFAPALRSRQPSACSNNDATQFFTCPSVTSGGYTIVRKFRLLDGSGASVSTANPQTVVAVRSVIDVQGGPSSGFQISRHEDNTLSGLQTTTRTLNGIATQDLTLHDQNGALAMLTHDVSVTTDLSVMNSPDQRYPLSGTIVSDGTLTYGSSAPYAYHREIIFDGTNVMTMKQGQGSSTVTCKLPLPPSTGTITCTVGLTGL
jgi:hypothetical protein